MKRLINKFTPLAATLAVAVLFAACDTTSINNGSNINNRSNNVLVTLRFQTATATPNNANFTSLAAQEGDTLKVEGSNGTLIITDIHFIVDDFELERADGECEGLDGETEDDCEEFEKELFFVDLPLNGEPLELSTAPIQDGLYSSLEFEIDDLDLDEDEDSTEQQEKEALLADIREEFSNFPKAASMVVSGSFATENGQATEFTTFAEAEVEIEMEFTPPLEIQDGASKLVTVKISLDKWLTRSDGTVINLAEYDYSTTQRILEFEVEIEDGFESIEVEDD